MTVHCPYKMRIYGKSTVRKVQFEYGHTFGTQRIKNRTFSVNTKISLREQALDGHEASSESVIFDAAPRIRIVRTRKFPKRDFCIYRESSIFYATRFKSAYPPLWRRWSCAEWGWRAFLGLEGPGDFFEGFELFGPVDVAVELGEEAREGGVVPAIGNPSSVGKNSEAS